MTDPVHMRFHTRIRFLHWGKLFGKWESYDPKLVREFYISLYDRKEGSMVV